MRRTGGIFRLEPDEHAAAVYLNFSAECCIPGYFGVPGALGIYAFGLDRVECSTTSIISTNIA